MSSRSMDQWIISEWLFNTGFKDFTFFFDFISVWNISNSLILGCVIPIPILGRYPAKDLLAGLNNLWSVHHLPLSKIYRSVSILKNRFCIHFYRLCLNVWRIFSYRYRITRHSSRGKWPTCNIWIQQRSNGLHQPIGWARKESDCQSFLRDIKILSTALLSKGLSK